MKMFTTIAAMCLFGLMASAVHADEMASDGAMMDDHMEQSMDQKDMEKDDMSNTMDHGMENDDMAGDRMGMKDDKAMHDDMKNAMKDDGMGKSDSMN